MHSVFILTHPTLLRKCCFRCLKIYAVNIKYLMSNLELPVHSLSPAASGFRSLSPLVVDGFPAAPVQTHVTTQHMFLLNTTNEIISPALDQYHLCLSMIKTLVVSKKYYFNPCSTLLCLLTAGLDPVDRISH